MTLIWLKKKASRFYIKLIINNFKRVMYNSYYFLLENLKKNYYEFIKKRASEGTKLLGICLGMQLLFSSSDEGNLPGLSLIEGKVIKFPDGLDIKTKNYPYKVFDNVFDVYFSYSDLEIDLINKKCRIVPKRKATWS